MRPMRTTRPTSGARALLLSLLLGAGLTGCPPSGKDRPAPAEVIPVGRYADGAAGLQALWRDLLTACQKDDRQRVHDLMASLMLTKPELAELLGPEKGAAMWPRYESLMVSLANAGAMELVAEVYEKKYDDVTVVRVDELPEGERLPAERQALAALAKKVPLYTVRVKRKTEPKGLRYDFFVYVDGRWRTGNQLGKYVEASAPKTAPAPAPVSAPAPAPAHKGG
jgi:hypothetical protein